MSASLLRDLAYLVRLDAWTVLDPDESDRLHGIADEIVERAEATEHQERHQ